MFLAWICLFSTIRTRPWCACLHLPNELRKRGEKVFVSVPTRLQNKSFGKPSKLNYPTTKIYSFFYWQRRNKEARKKPSLFTFKNIKMIDRNSDYFNCQLLINCGIKIWIFTELGIVNWNCDFVYYFCWICLLLVLVTI